MDTNQFFLDFDPSAVLPPPDDYEFTDPRWIEWRAQLDQRMLECEMLAMELLAAQANLERRVIAIEQSDDRELEQGDADWLEFDFIEDAE